MPILTIKCREEFLSHCEDEGSDEDKGIALFNVFDEDASGTMDFPEFLMASNALKLRFVETLTPNSLKHIMNLLAPKMIAWLFS